MNSFLDDLCKEYFTKPIASQVRKKLEPMSEEELKQIVKIREQMPWFRKVVRTIFDMDYFRENLEYRTARDILDGKLSWKEVDKKNAQYWREILREERKYLHERLLFERGKKVVLFMGDFNEYERLTRGVCEILNNGQEFAFSNHDEDFIKLGRMRADALIHFHYLLRDGFTGEVYGFGIPVKKKRFIRPNKNP